MPRTKRSSSKLFPFANASLSNTSVWMSPQATCYNCAQAETHAVRKALVSHSGLRSVANCQVDTRESLFIASLVQDHAKTIPDPAMAGSRHRAVAQRWLKQSAAKDLPGKKGQDRRSLRLNRLEHKNRVCKWPGVSGIRTRFDSMALPLRGLHHHHQYELTIVFWNVGSAFTAFHQE